MFMVAKKTIRYCYHSANRWKFLRAELANLSLRYTFSPQRDAAAPCPISHSRARQISLFVKLSTRLTCGPEPK